MWFSRSVNMRGRTSCTSEVLAGPKITLSSVACMVLRIVAQASVTGCRAGGDSRHFMKGGTYERKVITKFLSSPEERISHSIVFSRCHWGFREKLTQVGGLAAEGRRSSFHALCLSNLSRCKDICGSNVRRRRCLSIVNDAFAIGYVDCQYWQVDGGAQTRWSRREMKCVQLITRNGSGTSQWIPSPRGPKLCAGLRREPAS